MKILLIIPSLAAGGAERVMSVMANYWENKHDVSFLLLTDERPFYSLEENIKVIRLGTKEESKNPFFAMLNNYKRIRKLRENIRRLAPDIIISFLTETNVLSILASANFKIPIIISERSNPYMDITVNKIWGFLRKITYPFASAIVLQTSFSAVFFRKYNKNLSIIPNPIVPETINFTAAREKIILTVGRFTPEKQTDHIIKAFSQIRTDWKLYLIGDGPLRKTLETLVRDFRLQERVVFLGQIKSVKNYLKRASIFVLTSKYEGFPNALCEAMSYGVPSISYDNQNDIISNMSNGLIVRNGDQKELVDKISLLIEDNALRVKLGVRAKEINKRLSVVKIMEQWEGLILEVLGYRDASRKRV